MRWAARRGMLELDLLLEPFVRERYPQLDAQDRETFARLMACEDQELFGWMLQREVVDDAELANIVKQILQFARAAPGPA
jgi:antitoxin CptB